MDKVLKCLVFSSRKMEEDRRNMTGHAIKSE